MKIYATWQKSINLVLAKNVNAIYETDLDKLPEEPGCYVIYNQYGKSSKKILYIGQALNLRGRIKSQLNNLKLMKGIKNGFNGTKKIIYCTIQFRGRQRNDMKKVMNILENNLIKVSILNEHPILNKQGMKLTDGDINFNNNSISKYFFKKDKIVLEK